MHKRYPVETTQQMQWGRDVHKAFEDYLLHGVQLKPDLAMHEDFLASFKALPGELAGEERIALDTNLRGCGYFDKSVTVWWRGQVDARKRYQDSSYILDHKTGKVKNDFRQLKQFAIHEFLTQPQIQHVRVEYYWTQTRAASGEQYVRQQLPDLLRELAAPLARYVESYRTGVWNPKQSGLCRGWCPVKTCEFWSERRPRP